MTDTAPNAVDAADSMTGKLESDLTCIQCGYNLRTLFVDAMCPECGTPVERSLHGDRLACSDARWLGKLRHGAGLLLFNVCLAFIGALFASVYDHAGYGREAWAILQMVTSGVSLLAMLLLTSPEPRVELREDPVTLRRVVRGCALIMFVIQFMSQLVNFLNLGEVFTGLAILATLAVSCVAYFGTLIFFRRFARRIPDSRLEKQTSLVMWSLVVTGFIVCASIIWVAAIADSKLGDSWERFIIITLVAGIAAGIIWCFIALATLFRYFVAFGSALEAARNATRPSQEES